MYVQWRQHFRVTRWTSRRPEKLSGSEPRASRRLDLGQLAKCDMLLVSDNLPPPPSPRHSRLNKCHRQCQKKPRAAGRSTCFRGKDELPNMSCQKLGNWSTPISFYGNRPHESHLNSHTYTLIKVVQTTHICSKHRLGCID